MARPTPDTHGQTNWDTYLESVFNDLYATTINGYTALAADFPINSGAANALQDVGLTAAMLSGKMYYFKMWGVYTVGASTTGSRWSLNIGATPTFLAFASTYGLTATTVTANAMLTAVQLPATSNVTSNVSNGGANMVNIEGLIQPSADGTFSIQGAREVTTDTVTLKAGAFLQYKKLT